MAATGAVFQPEVITLMKTILEEAAATLPEAKRTSSMKANLAVRILELAATGERDPIALKAAALCDLTVNPCHDISDARRAV